MPELGPHGFVRGARGNSRPYRDPRPTMDIGIGRQYSVAPTKSHIRDRRVRLYTLNIDGRDRVLYGYSHGGNRHQ
jgi:hypothetical protein